MSRSERSLEARKQPRQSRARTTQQRILDAAARVFEAHGYAGGTTNRIAEEAGLSVGSVYQYYPNKDAILVELMRLHIATGVDEIQRRLADSGGVPARLEDIVHLFVDAALANHADRPRLHQVLFEEAPRPTQLLAELHELELATVLRVRHLLSEHGETRVDDLDMAAYLVVAAIESLTHRYISSPSPPGDTMRFTQQLVDLIVNYLHGHRAALPSRRRE